MEPNEIVRRVEAIKARCDAATPGPWKHNYIHTEWGDVHEALIPFDLGLNAPGMGIQVWMQTANLSPTPARTSRICWSGLNPRPQK